MTYKHKIYHRSFLFKLVYIFDVPLFLLFDIGIVLMYFDSAISLFKGILGFCSITALLLYFLNGLIYTVKITEREITIIRLFKKREVINVFNMKKKIEIICNRNSRVTAFDLIITDKLNKKYFIRYITKKLLDQMTINGYNIPNNLVKKKYFF